MARPKEFDLERALHRAISAFPKRLCRHVDRRADTRNGGTSAKHLAAGRRQQQRGSGRFGPTRFLG